MFPRLQLQLFKLYGCLPRRVRVRLIHVLAPTFTVGTICVVERDDGAVLLVRHSYKRRWGFPGGLVKRREEVVDAAHREATEELGLSIELVGEPVVVVDPRPRRVDIVFRAKPTTGVDVREIRSRSPEVVEARWFLPDALPELQLEARSAVMALVRQRAALLAPLPFRLEGIGREPHES